MDAYVTHRAVSDFANEKVNLKRDAVREYRDQVQRLRTRLEEHIAAHPDYGFVKSRQAGSLAKGTALSTLNDVDLAVYVEASEAPAIEGQLLNWMEARLKDALKPLGLKDDQFQQQTHCVTIEYRGTGLAVDVAPVLYEGDPHDVGYLIPKDTGQRVRTSVTQHLEFIRSRKADTPDLAQVIRLCKWWKAQVRRRDEGFRFKSFMIELVCAHLADGGMDFSDYPRALEGFFAYLVRTELRERIAFDDYYELSALPGLTGAEIEIFDPVNPENNVASVYSAAQRMEIVEAAASALDALSEAAYAEGKGRGVDHWRAVLGPAFRA